MRKRAQLGAALLALTTIAALPALAQLGPLSFRFDDSLPSRALGGSYYTVRWEDVREEGVDPGLFSITWYYSTDREGQNRRRMASNIFRDDFSRGFRQSWRPEGAFAFGWKTRRDRVGDQSRDVLIGADGAGPCVSQRAFFPNTVTSVLVQPDGLRSKFALGYRMQNLGAGYELRFDDNRMILSRSGVELRNERMSRGFTSRDWYWVETGFRNLKQDVIVRVRVYDEKHERQLGRLDFQDKPGKELMNHGYLALRGPACFAEVYVDPWEARWVDGKKNEFQWDTTGVPEGKYFLLAELANGRQRLPVASDFQVEVARGTVDAD